MKLSLPSESNGDAGVWFSTPASTRYPTHWHEELEINLVLWGSAQYKVRHRVVEIGPGSLLLLAPGEPHTLLEVSEDLAMWVSAFRPEVVRGAQKISGVEFPAPHDAWSVRQLEPPLVSELSALHAHLLPCHELRPQKLSPQQLLGRVLLAWRNSQGTQARAGVSTSPTLGSLHQAVSRARVLLSEPDGPPSLSLLSRSCGLETSRLSRLFKQQMGLSVVQFRNHFRVQQFIECLGYGDQVTMLDAALRCGFGSYAQFHRAFHQVTSYAPSEHLRRVRAGIVVPVRQGFRERSV